MTNRGAIARARSARRRRSTLERKPPAVHPRQVVEIASAVLTAGATMRQLRFLAALKSAKAKRLEAAIRRLSDGELGDLYSRLRSVPDGLTCADELHALGEALEVQLDCRATLRRLRESRSKWVADLCAAIRGER